jgi:hypothetical protein
MLICACLGGVGLGQDNPVSGQARNFGAAATWDEFVNQLRAGRMREAYDCFSPESRKVFSYRQFSSLYSPLTAAYEAVLSPLDNGRFNLAGDVARLKFIAAGSDDGEGIMVTATLVREYGQWFLVAAERERIALAEAELRNFLRAANDAPEIQYLRSQNREINDLREAAPRTFRHDAALLCSRTHVFMLKYTPYGLALCGAARGKGLRSFIILPDGRLFDANDPIPLPEQNRRSASEIIPAGYARAEEPKPDRSRLAVDVESFNLPALPELPTEPEDDGKPLFIQVSPSRPEADAIPVSMPLAPVEEVEESAPVVPAAMPVAIPPSFPAEKIPEPVKEEQIPAEREDIRQPEVVAPPPEAGDPAESGKQEKAAPVAPEKKPDNKLPPPPDRGDPEAAVPESGGELA